MQRSPQISDDEPDDRSNDRHWSRSLLAVFILLGCAVVWLILGTDLTSKTSPTVDEVPHAAAGWAIRMAHDFRVNPEHPPLWKLVSAVPHDANALEKEFSSPTWQALRTRYDLEWVWATNLLYRHDPLRGVDYIKRSRSILLLFGLILGAAITRWSWRLGGPFAAVLGGLLFTFEPNLLAHSALVTSDIPFTAMFLVTLLILSTRANGRWRYVRAIATGIALGLALATKFSALLLAPVVALLILIRPWVDRAEIGTPRLRVRRTVIELMIVVTISYATLWASYGFRFAPSPGGDLMDVTRAVDFLQYKSQRSGQSPGGLAVDFAMFSEKTRLMPQAWCVGLIWAQASTLEKSAYLLGDLSTTGWWYYFPVALAVKLSSILILAFAAALIVALCYRRHVRIDPWELVCVALPSASFLLVSIGSNLNIGIRHVFPVVPALIILSTVPIAAAIRGRRVRSAVATALLIFGGWEMAQIHPHQLSYFNLFAGGWRQGIDLLGESNLDWGQDLERLAYWHREHPCSTIHLAYSGTTPPGVLGIEYEQLPIRGSASELPALNTRRDEVLIVSSHYLQGIDVGGGLLPFYTMLRSIEPDEIIGTTLYVYRIGPQISCN